MSAPLRAGELRGVPLFEGLSDDDLQRIRERVRETAVPAGTLLVNMPHSGEAVYVILAGSAAVQLVKSDGSRSTLFLLGPGDCILEVGHIHPHVPSTCVITRQETRLLWMEGKGFLRCVERSPSLARNLTRELSLQLRRADAHICALASLDVTGRVSCQILDLAEHWGTPVPGRGIQIPVPVTQGEIAEMTAATRDRVHLIMTRLQRAGVFTMDSEDRMTVHRPEILAQLSRV
jgi:CRP-like cAMP-binding protein